MSALSFVQINEVIVGLFPAQADINLHHARQHFYLLRGKAVLLWRYSYSCFPYNDYPWGLDNDCIVHSLSTPQGSTWTLQLNYHTFL